MGSPKGLHCPGCKGFRLTVTDTVKPAAGVRIRYRCCSACGTRIKTREVIVHVYPAKPAK